MESKINHLDNASLDFDLEKTDQVSVAIDNYELAVQLGWQYCNDVVPAHQPFEKLKAIR